MARQTRPPGGQKEPNVRVHLSAGCPVAGCGRTDEHSHTQGNWRRVLDEAGKTLQRGR